jgi:IS5 family transposase
LKRFRAWIREKKGADWIFGLSIKLPREAGLVRQEELQGVDSTNTECRGAVIDTYNLIAAAIREVVRAMARVLDRDVLDLAREWAATRYLARSVKGQAAIDWSDEKARNALLTSEIFDVERIATRVENFGVAMPKDVMEAISLMRQLAKQDTEQLPDGTFRIAHGTVPGRIISVTDPEARHGRKSASKTITGFKTHVVGTLESQFVTGITMTDAGTHDALPTPELLRQAEQNSLKPKELVGDAAYGTGANRRACNAVGVSLYTKLPAPSHKAFTKRDFTIDLEAMSVTCPAGITTTKYGMVKDPSGSEEKVPQFRFPTETCRACPLQEKCGSSTATRGRQIALSRHEPEIQEAQRFNAKAEAGSILRKRSAVERLIAHLVRMGMRQARFFGLYRVQFQACMTAAAYNLQRYFTLIAA